MGWLPLVLALASGWLLAVRAGPARGLQPRWAARLLEAGAGAGLGMALSSVAYFLLLEAGAASRGSILAVHLAMAAAAGFLAWGSRRDAEASSAGPAAPVGRTAWVLALLVAAVLIPAVLADARISASNPHGQWDAWAIWNLRAKFLAGEGDAWRYALSPLLNRTHPDYPLLVSGLVAVNWRAGGGTMDPAVPGVITYLFPLAAAAVLLAGLALLRGVHLGLVALLVLLADGAYLTHSTGQMSDVPLSFYYVAAIVCYLVSFEPQGRPAAALALAGALAGMAAWTKDEGMAFLAVSGAWTAAFELWEGRLGALRRRLPWLVLGALPGALLAAWLKLFLAPQPGAGGAAAAAGGGVSLFTARRLTNLVEGIAAHFGERAPGLLHPAVVLAVAVAALGLGVEPRLRRRAAWLGVLVAGLFAVYCAAIVANPAMLGGKWAQPMDRMFSQLWPTVVLLAMVVARRWEVSSPAAGSAPAAAASASGRKKRRGERR